MIKFSHVAKQYHANVSLFTDLSFSVEAGSWVYLRGNSGQGKSTLLKLIAGISRPDSGAIEVDGYDISQMSLSNLPYFRRRIGFVFQEYALLDDVSALKNVMHPLLIEGLSMKAAKERALTALSCVKSNHLADEMPRYLSGGQQQLISIARAIVNQPKIIIADEPTANLDRDNSLQIIELLRSFHRGGTTCIISTHDRFPEQAGEHNFELMQGLISARVTEAENTTAIEKLPLIEDVEEKS